MTPFKLQIITPDGIFFDGMTENVIVRTPVGDKGILAVGQDMKAVTMEMISEMVDDDSELISIYYGEEIPEEDAAAIAEEVEDKYPDCDVELQYGGQPIYYYIVSVE